MSSTKARVRPFYAPYHQWEDWLHGMYRKANPTDFERMKGDAAALLSDSELCRETMRRVVREWPVSAKVNLTNDQQNHRPWLGQAACCFANGCNEEATRAAWVTMTNPARIAANNFADRVFEEFVEQYKSGRQLLFDWRWTSE